MPEGMIGQSPVRVDGRAKVTGTATLLGWAAAQGHLKVHHAPL